LLAVGYTLVFAVVLVLALLLLVFGNRIFLYIQSRVPFFEHAAVLVIVLRTVVAFAVLTAFFFGLYLLVPNRKSSRAAKELPGAVLTAAGWLGFSYLYSLYIDRMANFSAMYGSLTAIVLCMIWLYACMYLMFIGAEFNVVAENPAVREAWRAFRSGVRAKKKRSIKR
jgi:membrane protein